MRTSLSYLTVLFSVIFSTASLAEQSLVRDFATCTGRLSAEVEHAWLMSSEEANKNEELYKNMAALLEAVTLPNEKSRAMAMRIDAKVAHGRLLLQSAFGWDIVQRKNAKIRAAELLGACSTLVLVGGKETPDPQHDLVQARAAQ